MQKIKNLPLDWKWVTIEDITLPIDKTHPKKNPKDPFVYVDISSIDNSINKITDPKNYLGEDAPSRARQLIKKGDVLFSTVRTYLKNIAFVPEIYHGQIASTGFSVLRAKEFVDSKFLFYYCLTQEFLEPLNSLQRGTSYPAVRDGDVRSQPFPLPPLDEQKIIVSKIEELFSQLDAGVAGLKRVQTALKRYRASVLKAAFEGRLVPQDPDDEPASEVLRRMGKESLKSDDLIPLPENWVWTTIDDIGNVKGGKRLPKGHSYSEDKTKYPYIRVVDLINNSVDLSNLEYLTPTTWEEIKKYTISKNDVYISIAGSIGKVGVVPELLDGANLTENAAKLTDLHLVNNKYLALFLDSPFAKEQILSFTISTNQPKLALFRIKKIILPLPPQSEQIRIVNEVERILTVIHRLEIIIQDNINRSYRLRKTILKSAFEGKLSD
mgnify:CR=1 FL=1